MTTFWFKPKTYGFGATPVTWQGWLLVLFHVAVVVAVMVLLGLGGITAERLAAGAVLVLLVSMAVVWVSVVKTEGRWEWRWGAGNKS
jgi:hypothetical protein